MADNNNLLNSFYSNRTIQRPYLFLVWASDISNALQDIMVNSFSFDPSYTIKSNKMEIGPFSFIFPLMESDGIKFSVGIDEDNKGSLSKTIIVLQKKLINEDGTHKFIQDMKIEKLRVSVLDEQLKQKYYYEFRDVFFIGTTETKYDYNTNEPLRQTLNFVCNRYNLVYV